MVQKVKIKMGVGKWYLELFEVKHEEQKSSLICQYFKINTDTDIDTDTDMDMDTDLGMDTVTDMVTDGHKQKKAALKSFWNNSPTLLNLPM